MRISIPGLLSIIFLIWSCSSTKNIPQSDDQLTRLRKHVEFLADDKLEGRRTGSKGEELAMQYISEQFKEIGLSPKGTEYYIQSFPVNEGKKIDDVTELTINGDKLLAGKDFFPFPFSPNQRIEAVPSLDIQELGMPWFFDLKEVLEENKSNPHFDLT